MVVRCARRSLQLAAACIIVLVAFGCGSSSSTGGGGTGGGSTSGDTTGGTSGGTITSRTVTGYISDLTSGQGVSGAVVSIGGQVAQTGGTGLYTISAVPRQTQAVTVTCSNYKTFSGTLPASQDQLNKRLIPVGVSVNYDDYDYPPDAVGR